MITWGGKAYKLMYAFTYLPPEAEEKLAEYATREGYKVFEGEIVEKTPQGPVFRYYVFKEVT
jgi:hypothetical protein